MPWLNASTRQHRLTVDTRALFADVWRRHDLEANHIEESEIIPVASFIDSIPEGSFPAVVLNAGIENCDALIIRSREGMVQHVPLSQCNRLQLDALARRTATLLKEAGISVRRELNIQRGSRPFKSSRDSFETLLATVWHTIVQPITAALDLKVRRFNKRT